MREIETSIYSHLSFGVNRRYSLRQVNRSEPEDVECFSDLVRKMAYISHYNKDFMLFYRGQHMDFKGRRGNSTFLPSIFRGELDNDLIRERYDRMLAARKLLVEYFSYWQLPGVSNIRRREELCWAILQHYEVCSTPLIDMTHSLAVACTFALLGNPGDHGYVFVFGMPYTTNRISYNVENDIVNMRLLNICPPMALRPYFQDAYLVGSFPFARTTEEVDKLDFSRRLIGKFRIPAHNFWTDGTQAIPKTFIYPEEDEMGELCKEIRYNIAQQP